jgi:hypothetical protein
VYDIVKLITARTRLDGWCPEYVFDEFVKDASLKSGLSEKKIISYLIDGEDAPILKEKREGNKKNVWIYKARSVYERWYKIGWIDSSKMTKK